MGSSIIGQEKSQANSKTALHWYKAWFGSNPLHVMVTWVTLKENDLLHLGSRIYSPLVMGILWLKDYRSEAVSA
eukprot:14152904-Ditylum_brightwellii.AAC.1